VRRLRIHQQDAFISVDYQTQEVRKYFKGAAGIAFDVIRPESREPLREELKDFVSCVLGRSCPRVSGREATQALEIVLRINDILKQ
jgi:predicted dehydrogenase